MQIGAMNHPARDPVAEIHWIGDHGFDFVDLTLEAPAADPGRIESGGRVRRCWLVVVGSRNPQRK